MSRTLKVRKLSRRQALAILGAGFGAVVLAACGANQTPQAPTIKLTLRKGVTFHSGREFTSDDVKYNLLRVRDPAHAQLGGMSSWYTIETPDKSTVILSSDQPRPLAFDLLEYLNITDKDLAEGPDAKSKAGGTGPFTLVEWVSGDHVSFTRNKNYWQSGKPYLDDVNVAILKDPEAMSLQFDSG